MSIQTKNLTITFKNGVVAVNKVNLNIESGIYGLLGENGAGKTTLMRAMTTILKPTQGELFLNDIKYCDENYEKIKEKIGYLPQELDLYPNLTVKECLEYLGMISGLMKAVCRNRIDFYLERTNLMEHKRKKIRQLSGGMKRRVGLIQALLHDPEILIVDEPTTGLDPEERIRIRNLLVDFSKERVVLFSTHVVEDLAATCNHLAVMKKGEMIYDGNVLNLLNQARGHIWTCNVENEEEIKELERRYYITSKQYNGKNMTVKLISNEKPDISCIEADVTLEDAYIYISNFQKILALTS